MSIPEPGGYQRDNAATFGSGTLCFKCGKPFPPRRKFRDMCQDCYDNRNPGQETGWAFLDKETKT